jgi:hypothetical protein
VDPQSVAHLVRILRSISVELRIANDIAATAAGYPARPLANEALDIDRDRYREQMT